MKLIKYIINLIILTGSIYFLLELSELNQTTTPDGVIEKKLSAVLSVLSNTKCFSIMHAPTATEASGTSFPSV